MRALDLLTNEQYDPRLLPGLRPVMYKLLLFLEIPQEFFLVHDACLTYVQALVAMEQFDEAFTSCPALTLPNWMNTVTANFPGSLEFGREND